MNNELYKIIYDNYGIVISNMQILPGGWLNKKYIIDTTDNNRYVVKIYSTRKVEKMSNNEFSINYLDTQTKNNLKIENYMYENGLNCEKIISTKDNEPMINYQDERLSLTQYIKGTHVSREDISNSQLYNLGHECGKMHNLFKDIDDTIYRSGRYLKLPTLDELKQKYQNKIRLINENTNRDYLELLKLQMHNITEIENKEIIDQIPICLTHGDFADDNILFENDNPKILDFELVRINSKLLDIGRIIMSYCYNNNELSYTKIDAFQKGYNSVNCISKKDILLSLITVWINEVDMWIIEKYFDREITPKSKRFQEELIYLTKNLTCIIDSYINAKKEVSFYNKKSKRRLII